MSDLRYPIGKFTWVAPENETQSAQDRQRYIAIISQLPENMRTAVNDLTPQQLYTRLIVPKAGRCGNWCIITPKAT